MKVHFRGGSLRRGLLLNWASLLINFGAAFILTPIVIRTLGPVGFGMWSLILSFSGYYGLINLGLTAALQRSISKAIAENNSKSLKGTISTAIAFFTLSGSLVLLLALCLAAPAAVFFEISPAIAASFRLTLILCAIAVVADFFGALVTTMLTALERFDLMNGFGIGRQLIQSAGIIAALHYHPSIGSMAAVVCATSIGSLLIGWVTASRLYPGIRMSWHEWELLRLKEMLHFGSSMVLLRVSNVVRLRLGNLVLAKTTGIAAVAQFSLASNLIVNLNTIVDATLKVLTPRFTRLEAQANIPELQRLYRIALFISATMAFGMALMIFVFGERFITLWVGDDYRAAAVALKILIVAYAVALAQAPSWNLMLALAKHHFMTRVALVEAVAIVALGLWLSFSHGAIGFAWATTIAMLVTKLFIQPPYSAKLAQMSLYRYLEPMSIPCIVAIGLLAASHFAGVEESLRENGLSHFLWLASFHGFAYLGTILYLSRRKTFAPQVWAALCRIGRSSAATT